MSMLMFGKCLRVVVVGALVIGFVCSEPVRVKTGQRKFTTSVFPKKILNSSSVDSKTKLAPVGEVKHLPGYGKLQERSFAGYVEVNVSCGSYIYFWLIESQSDPDHDPILVWLNGGPGTSSFLGALSENGPFLVSDDGTVSRNPFSWNRKATYIMIDQPAGVGFSMAKHEACFAPDETTAVAQLYSGLSHLLMRHLPRYGKLPLYIFGESYGGIYVPQLASLVLDHAILNLAGIALGDGWVDPRSLEKTYAEYAYSHGLLSLEGKAAADRLQADCSRAWSSIEVNASASPDDWRALDNTCNKIEAFIVKESGGVDVFDVRRFQPEDSNAIATYLNRKDVRRALRVDPRVGVWKEDSDTVAYLMQAQEEKSSAHLLPRILSQSRVLVYNGVFDMDCNYIGTDAWLSALGEGWSPGSKAYDATKRKPWRPGSLDCVGCGSEMRGQALELGNLTQVLVFGAGHLVPVRQPESAAILVETFLSGHSLFDFDRQAKVSVLYI
eukprot:TRINITY_DN69833_c0_g1_i1.p1 TRINITY_DN69833_c0_g1~~TRINITY_DN69833_c0_g1_i1.p1  ORF type:complete len:497 (-),score=51.79 TRINITY_DN69833_c0_g1_i1:117-1607(-)